MLDLKDLENRTIYIVRETYAEFKKPAVLWSDGKGQHHYALALSQSLLR